MAALRGGLQAVLACLAVLGFSGCIEVDPAPPGWGKAHKLVCGGSQAGLSEVRIWPGKGVEVDGVRFYAEPPSLPGATPKPEVLFTGMGEPSLTFRTSGFWQRAARREAGPSGSARTVIYTNETRHAVRLVSLVLDPSAQSSTRQAVLVLATTVESAPTSPEDAAAVAEFDYSLDRLGPATASEAPLGVALRQGALREREKACVPAGNVKFDTEATWWDVLGAGSSGG